MCGFVGMSGLLRDLSVPNHVEFNRLSHKLSGTPTCAPSHHPSDVAAKPQQHHVARPINHCVDGAPCMPITRECLTQRPAPPYFAGSDNDRHNNIVL